MEYLFARTDQLFELVTGHSALWVYLFVLFSMTLENFFPPYPGDTVVFICAVYASGGYASLPIIYALSVVGTLISVMSLYYVGGRYGRVAFSNSKLRWLNLTRLGKIEHWFDHWGDKVLILSRYLSGVRAALALFAGVGAVRPWKMLIYSLISTLTWNFLVIYLGYELRQDWHKIDKIFDTYSTLTYVGIALLVIAVITRTWYKRWKSKSE